MHRTRTTLVVATAAATLASAPAAAGPLYTLVNIGIPANADSVIGVRMNDLGHIAGYSVYYGQGEPSIKPWMWTPENGFTILPPPPNMFLGRARAMDISNSGIVAGDGGYDAGLAWRYENGVYETFGAISGLPIAYLGGVNEAGDVAGTARDAQITTPDEPFLDVNGEGTIGLVPGAGGGRATDLNEVGQVCGYTQAFHAVRWNADGTMQPLGVAGLAYSFSSGMNDLGAVVGRAASASGNTTATWIYTDAHGQQLIPAPVHASAVTINNKGVVVGNTSPGSGPDYGWIWTPETGVRTLFEMFDLYAAGYSGVVAHDINEAGQILAFGYDNNAGGFRTLLLVPNADAPGACCLPGGGCTAEVTETECLAQGGAFRGIGTACDACIPIGACCRGDGSCVEFTTAAECAAVAGTWQGADSSCALTVCVPGVVNDDCADALPIALGDTPFSTLGATTDGPPLPSSCPQPAGQSFFYDVWYEFTPTATGVLRVSTCNQADYDTRLAAYLGGCDGLDIIACADSSPGCYYGTTEMDVAVTACEPILIRIGCFSVYSGSGTLTLEYTTTGEACAACATDLDGSGVTDFGDLLALLAAWSTVGGPADLDGNGTVGFEDLLVLLGDWGPCP